jgi:hypothetical protein
VIEVSCWGDDEAKIFPDIDSIVLTLRGPHESPSDVAGSSTVDVLRAFYHPAVLNSSSGCIEFHPIASDAISGCSSRYETDASSQVAASSLSQVAASGLSQVATSGLSRHLPLGLYTISAMYTEKRWPAVESIPLRFSSVFIPY